MQVNYRFMFLLGFIFMFDASELSLNVSFKFDFHVRCKYRFTFLFSLIYTFDASELSLNVSFKFDCHVRCK